MLPKFLIETYKFLLDLVFPIECLGCGREGHWICPACLAVIEPFPPERLKAIRLTSCRKIFVGTDYQNPLIAKSIHALKYKMVENLAGTLAAIITRQLAPDYFPPGSVLVPVPLHRARLVERGFNQSERLVRHLAKYYRLPVANNVLARVKHTKPQMSLQRASRQQNIRQAFRCVAPAAVKGKHVFLIDDVLTTGATIHECAKALAAGQPKSINAIVVAHSAD